MKPDPSIEKLPEAVADLFTEDREERLAPAGSRARVLGRLDASLGGGVAAPAPRAPTPSLLTRALPWITLVAGIGIGAAWSPRSKAPPSAETSTPAPTTATSPPTPVVSVPETPPPPSPAAEPPAVTPSSGAVKKPSAPAGSSDDATRHAQERSLLDGARTALARRDGAGALMLLERHRARFPSGALAEERDALTVQGLAMEGRTNEARTRAASFAKSYPNSLFLPAVEAAVKTSP